MRCKLQSSWTISALYMSDKDLTLVCSNCSLLFKNSKANLFPSLSKLLERNSMTCNSSLVLNVPEVCVWQMQLSHCPLILAHHHFNLELSRWSVKQQGVQQPCGICWLPLDKALRSLLIYLCYLQSWDSTWSFSFHKKNLYFWVRNSSKIVVIKEMLTRTVL